MNQEAEVLLQEYCGHGIRFLYPGFWELSEEADGEDIVITAAADQSCFWLLRIFPTCPPAEHIIESCLQAYDDEYDDAEAETVQLSISGMTSQSRRIRFSCFELLNTAAVSSVRVSEASLLSLWQCTDHELENLENIFEQMTRSITILSLLDD